MSLENEDWSKEIDNAFKLVFTIFVGIALIGILVVTLI